MDNLGTIESVQGAGTWESSYGLMYAYEITLKDGRTGQVNSKAPDYWKPGDDVEIRSEQHTQYGTRWKLGRPQMAHNDSLRAKQAKPSTLPGSNSYDERDKRITNSWAITTAIAWNELQGSKCTLNQLIFDANRFIALRDTLQAEQEELDKVLNSKPEPAPAPAKPKSKAFVDENDDMPY